MDHLGNASGRPRAALAGVLICSCLGLALRGQELARTPIRDVLFHADGSLVEGMATISWKSFTAVDGSTVTSSSIDVAINDGVLAVDLTANEGATPSGLSYRVDYTLNSGVRFAETWVVPESGTPLTVSDVRVPLPPRPGVSIPPSQVSGLLAALAEKADLTGSNVFTGTQTVRESSPGSSLLGLELEDGSQGIYFKLPPLTQSTTYTLPFTDGLPSQALTTDGAGNLFWATVSGGPGATGQAYEIFQNDGSSLFQRSTANFSSAFLLVDNVNAARTEIGLNFGSNPGTVTAGDDARLSDARAPLPHAGTHAAGGSDPLFPIDIGALSNGNDSMVGTQPSQPVLQVHGAPGQTAALQEWRAGDGSLAGVITEQGSSFFREMGLAAKIGEDTVSQFLQIGGKNKFALTAVDGVFDIARYDDAGAFKDRAFRIQRSGNLLATVGMEITDAAAGNGRLTLKGDYLEFDAVGAPTDPTSGFGRVFLDSSSGELSVKKDAGEVVSLERELPAGTAAGQCPSWDQALGEWTPGPCAFVIDSLVWHFPGTPASGPQAMLLSLPDGVSNPMLMDSRIVADSLGASDTGFNIERCTAGCSGASPTFSPIYGADVTLAAATRTIRGGEPDVTAVAAGELFRINLPTVGSGVSDVTVTLMFEHELLAVMSSAPPPPPPPPPPPATDCAAVCQDIWDDSGSLSNPFGPVFQSGDACACFSLETPTKG